MVGKLPLFKARGIQDYKLPAFLSHIEDAHAQHLYLHDMKRPAGSQPANRVQAILRYISSPEGLQWSVRDCSEVSLPSGRVTWIFRGEESRHILVSHNEWTVFEDKDEMQFLNTARERQDGVEAVYPVFHYRLQMAQPSAAEMTPCLPCTLKFVLLDDHVGCAVGKEGKTKNELMYLSSCQIDLSAFQDFHPADSQVKGRVVRIYGPTRADTWQGALRVINKVSEDEGTMLPRLQLSLHGIRFVIPGDKVGDLMGVGGKKLQTLKSETLVKILQFSPLVAADREPATSFVCWHAVAG